MPVLPLLRNLFGTDASKDSTLELLAIVAQKTDNAVIITDKDGRIDWVNEAFTRISGYAFDEAIGRTPGRLLQGPDTDAETVKRIGKKVRAGESVQEEILNYHKDGTPYWLDLRITPVRNDVGEVVRFIAIEADVTERKKLDLQLQELSVVAQKTDNAVIITTPEGAIEWVNEGFTRISGYTLDEVAGRKPGSFLQGPETSPEAVQKIRENLRFQRAFQQEILNYHKDGRPYWLLLSITPVFNRQGELVRFIAIEADITKQKETEQSLRELNEELAAQTEEIRQAQEEIEATNEELARKARLIVQQNEELKARDAQLRELATVAQKTDNAVIISSAEGLIEWVNEGFTRISGYTLDEVRGRKPGHLLQGPETDKRTVARIREKLALREPFKEEILNYHKDGTPYWLSLSISPVFGPDGELERFIAIELDITEEKTRRLTMERQTRETQQSLDYAARIQHALLPDLGLLDRFVPEHFLLYQPKAVLSGDFYWMAERQGELYLAIGDATGHGVPGALMSVLGISLLNQLVQEMPDHSPAEQLAWLSAALVSGLKKKTGEAQVYDGMELLLGRYNPATRELKWAGANRHLYLLRGGKMNELTGVRQPLGFNVLGKPALPFESHELALETGDQLYMFTDGLQDQFGGPNSRKMGKRRLLEALGLTGTLPLKQQQTELERFFKTWQGDQEQLDDWLLLGLRV